MQIGEVVSSEMFSLHRYGRFEWLRHCLNRAPATGHILEFGVWLGHSIRVLAETAPSRRLHGFDSFIGLPEPWEKNESLTHDAGYLSTDGKLPDVPANVRLWQGWFSETVPQWLECTAGEIAFIHIDCDLYKSTKQVLTALDQRIVPGTVIVFDELIDFTKEQGYAEWENGEWRALHEWSEECDRAVVPIGRTDQYQVAVRVV